MDYIATQGAPKAIGPYSQAVLANGVLYTSGQISLDPQTGEIVPGDFAAQANRVFDNLAAVLAARDRTACGQVAPPDGLYLMRVDY